MDDLQFGSRNKRGDWSPNARPQIAFFWKTPFSLPKWVTFLVGYIWPWNVFHMAVTLLYWNYLLPDWETMKTLQLGLGPVALCGERRRHLHHVWRDRVLLLLEAQAGHAFQIQRQVPIRTAIRRVLVQEPEHRQFPAHLSVRHSDVDAGGSADAVVLRQRLCLLAELVRTSLIGWHFCCSLRR